MRYTFRAIYRNQQKWNNWKDSLTGTTTTREALLHLSSPLAKGVIEDFYRSLGSMTKTNLREDGIKLEHVLGMAGPWGDRLLNILNTPGGRKVVKDVEIRTGIAISHLTECFICTVQKT